VIKCRFIENFADGWGGGMCNTRYSYPTLINCTFSRNSSREYGGGMLNYNSDPTLVNCIFVGNSAGCGGGIHNDSGSPTLTNCVFSGNAARSGGGIYNESASDPILTNCTFSGNSGVAICNEGCPTVTNCIFWGNTDSSVMGEPAQFWFYDGRVTININYSCVQGWTGDLGGTGNIGADPLFWDADGADDVLGTEDDNPRLLPDSPCIDAGDPNYIAEPNETDLDGKPRVIGGRINMGAYESQYPRIMYVDDDAPNDPGPGNPQVSDPLEDGTQAHPFDAIQEAIDAAWHGETVIVLDGTYTGEGNRDIDFLGKAITVRSENGPEVTVIDCVGGEARGFYFHSGETVASVLWGFTIRNGHGGVFMMANSSPTLIDCTIVENRREGGAGVECWNSSPVLSNCTIMRNISDGVGGGINCWNSSPILTNCIIAYNYGTGGGASCRGSSIPVLINCTIIGNWAGCGGGVYCSAGASPKLINCLIAGNGAGRGAGLECYNASPVLTNCTLTGNWAWSFPVCSTEGGVMYCVDSFPILKNCTVWGNIGSEVGDPRLIVLEGSFAITVEYSCIEGSEVWPGDGNISQNPKFIQAGHWEENESEMFGVVWIDGDYSLLPDSPCINAGDPNYISEPNETDLEGNPRIIGGRIDMGAYESPIPAEVRIVPRTINLTSKGKWITCYISLPEDYNVADIIPHSVFLDSCLRSGVIPAKAGIQAQQLRIDEKQQIAIARFIREEVQAILSIGEVELIITGQLTDGTVFEAADKIKVIDKAGKN